MAMSWLLSHSCPGFHTHGSAILSASTFSQEAFQRQRGSLPVLQAKMLIDTGGDNPGFKVHDPPRARAPFWEPYRRAGRHLVVAVGWCQDELCRLQALETGLAAETIALCVTKRNKNISKCFSVQKVREQLRQQPPSEASLPLVCTTWAHGAAHPAAARRAGTTTGVAAPPKPPLWGLWVAS